MTVSSPVQKDVRDYIRRKLETLAVENRVNLLFGIESGSRAWGFPSADSDYDVRFVYRCTVDDYLSVADRRDVIETPTVHDEVLGVELDLNGWDIRKALQLALKSNAALLEWLNSPICYAKDEELCGLLQGFTNKAADLQALSYHYDRLARRAWEEILAGSTQVKLKRYCYALRSALALAWIGKNQTVPPMNIQQLMDGLSLTDDFRYEIDRMIEIKAGSMEKNAVDRTTALDRFIETTLAIKTQRPIPPVPPELAEEANHLFRRIISSVTDRH